MIVAAFAFSFCLGQSVKHMLRRCSSRQPSTTETCAAPVLLASRSHWRGSHLRGSQRRGSATGSSKRASCGIGSFRRWWCSFLRLRQLQLLCSFSERRRTNLRGEPRQHRGNASHRLCLQTTISSKQDTGRKPPKVCALIPDFQASGKWMLRWFRCDAVLLQQLFPFLPDTLLVF